ncbi:PIN domain-containing protein [Candidatus Woesearchaeota archaeon]|nr:PIN domain-containing protein [Candidatus Woesearchaeota archaeon]
MRFLDSNVLAYAFYNNEHLIKCQAAIMEGGLTDTFNLIEAFFIIEKETGSKEIAQKSIKGLLKSNIRIADTDINLVFEALKKVNRLRLSIFDAVHYSCALINGCSIILSYDKDFDNLDIPREEP